MKKVITYGTYDLLHYGHRRLLERAKALGDYLIVGVTADDYDKTRGKINVQQTLEERIAAVRALGIADKIIVEEYEGQKIDDIRRYEVDIFTVGSDWEGSFDYLKEYCEVVYLPRTEGVSSTEIRSGTAPLKLGMVGYADFLIRFYNESRYVNGVTVTGLCVPKEGMLSELKDQLACYTEDFDELLSLTDAVYIHSHPDLHFEQCREALQKGKHVLCESPVAMSRDEVCVLRALAEKNGCVLQEAIRTAYTTAYARMLLLLKSGKIGDVVSVDATCTSLSTDENENPALRWGALKVWGPTALLPIFQILGTDYLQLLRFVMKDRQVPTLDAFTKLDFIYKDAAASLKVGTGVKSEGELIVSGTKGYVYVPAPWWKTDYFELRFENPADNRRCFYQLDGEGIRYELVALARAVRGGKGSYEIEAPVTEAIAEVMKEVQK